MKEEQSRGEPVLTDEDVNEEHRMKIITMPRIRQKYAVTKTLRKCDELQDS